MMTEKNEYDLIAISVIKDVWSNPIGKIAFTAVGVLGLIAASGVLFKVAAFAMNNYKDLAAASKR